MKYLAAYLLLTVGGKNAPSVPDIENVLSTVGVEVESQRVESLLKELEGKNVEELIATGNEKLATVPSGGAAAAAAPAAGGDAPAAEESKKEEAKQEEESDEDMGFGLFD
ncbi:60S acidic ribosomal protein A2 [Schizosaccharomyces osmophilus]|uniref:60S acidic ribosomal protein A2 n=1 Tax=Schizosaccharomyces osmophilus TaxID=2545709 RepID=A0AAE9WFI0_9SCHI|nr:60S acidic ribosomal protein A2 [Schizosaccharomyces osmophilus]WBW75225.1 60S acidic ribosomal protein A2 [Schizosaccharomyces osmophilus]